MAQDEKKPQGLTREQCLEEAGICRAVAWETDSDTNAILNMIQANYYATLATIAPPTEPPTPPTQDGAALALLVALVSEWQIYFPTGEGWFRLVEMFKQAEDYVRTQAAKGEAGK